MHNIPLSSNSLINPDDHSTHLFNMKAVLEELTATDRALTIKNMPIIYLSNAEHERYFRGGDADFMHSLHQQLNKNGHTCFRVIEEELTEAMIQEAPNATTLNLDQFFVMHPKSAQTDNSAGSKKEKLINKRNQMRQRLLDAMIEKAKTHPVVLYIGSRMRVVEDDAMCDSGSLFTGAFLQEAKNILEEKITIIICCLEHKYFKRSLSDLKHLQCQITEHLLFADSVHFLNEHDLSNFKKLQEKCLEYVENIQNSPQDNQEITALLELKPHKKLLEPYKGLFALTTQTTLPAIKGIDNLRKLSELPSCFISGIYTIPPLTVHNPSGSQSSDTDSYTDIEASTITVDTLLNRPKKILWFGLVRKNKGLDSAEKILDLARMLKSCGYTLIIAGSFDADTSFGGIFALLMKETIKLFLSETLGDTEESKDSEAMKQEVEKIYIEAKTTYHQNPTPATLLVSPTNATTIELSRPKKAAILQTRKGQSLQSAYTANSHRKLTTDFNAHDKFIYDYLKNKKYIDFPYELEINPSNDDLHKIALNCRYAIKFDDKGMAHNASSIVSCLGLYLPTLTSLGMLTGDDFRPCGSFKPGSNKNDETRQYHQTIITPDKKYEVMTTLQKDNTENISHIMPYHATNEEICDFIKKDDETYKQRIEALYELHNTHGIFHAKSVASKIIEDVENLQNLRNQENFSSTDTFDAQLANF